MATKKIGGSLWFAIGVTGAIWVAALLSGPQWWYWCLIPTAIVVAGVIITTSQKVSDGRHPNMHYPDIAENSDPMTMSDGAPITNFLWWYTATRGRISREDAQLEIDAMHPDVLVRWKDMHHEYLKQFKNR